MTARSGCRYTVRSLGGVAEELFIHVVPRPNNKPEVQIDNDALEGA